ncbi:MAG: hypothetical protein DGJ47_001133, partial [Rickettsiaceae bacterium]
MGPQERKKAQADLYKSLLSEKGQEDSKDFPGLTRKDEYFIKLFSRSYEGYEVSVSQKNFLINCIDYSVGNIELNEKLYAVLQKKDHPKIKEYKNYISKIRKLCDKNKDNLENNDDFYIKLLNDTENKQSKLHPELTEKDEYFLKLLKKPKLSDLQQKFLKDRFHNAISDTKFCKILTNLAADKNNLNAWIYTKSIEDLQSFSYKSQGFDQIDKIHQKFTRNKEIIKKGSNISESEKLTYKEILIVKNLAKANEIYIKYLSPFKNKSLNKAHEIQEYFNKELIDNSRYKSGDLIFTKTSNTVVDKGPIYNYAEKINKYRHTGQVYSDNKGESIILSDFNYHHYYPDFDLKSALNSDVYRVNVVKLVPNIYHDKLQEIYDEGWKDILQNSFHVTNMSQNKNELKGVANDPWRQRRTLLAAITPFGNKKFTKQDYSKYYDQMVVNPKQLRGSSMICSEFAAKMQVSTLLSLNDQLKRELGVETDVIKLPFKYENLDVIHPERLYTLFEPCLEKVEMPDLY